MVSKRAVDILENWLIFLKIGSLNLRRVLVIIIIYTQYYTAFFLLYSFKYDENRVRNS